jgi:hypothetical protein
MKADASLPAQPLREITLQAEVFRIKEIKSCQA